MEGTFYVQATEKNSEIRNVKIELGVIVDVFMLDEKAETEMKCKGRRSVLVWPPGTVSRPDSQPCR